jgi:two-component system phosphate regulon sensor histidine kinase PhoR
MDDIDINMCTIKGEKRMKSAKLLPLSHWVAFVVLGLYPLFSVTEVSYGPWIISVAGLAALGMAYHALHGLRPRLNAGSLGFSLLGLDAVLICFFIYYTEGITSPFFPLIFLLSATASLYGHWKKALLVSGIISIAYAVSCLLEGLTFSTDGPRLLINVGVLLCSSALLSYLAELDRREHGKAERIEVLYRLSSELLENMDLVETLQHLLATTASIFKTDICSVWLVDKKSGTLKLKASILPGDDQFTVREIPLEEGLLGWVVKERVPVLIDDTSRDPRFDFSSQPCSLGRSLLAAPIMVGGEAAGVLCFANTAPRNFPAEDLQMLETVSNLAAAVINRAELYEIVLSRSEVIVSSMSSGLLVTDASGKIIMANQASRDLLGLERLPRNLTLRQLLEATLMDGDALWELIEGDPYLTGDRAHANLEVRLRGVPERILSLRISPIRAGYETSSGSVVIVEDITERVKVDEIRDDLMLLIARRVEEQTALYEVGRSLIDEVDTRNLMDFLLSKAVDLTDAELGALALRDEEGNLQVVATFGFDGGFPFPPQPPSDYLASEAIEKGEPIRRTSIEPRLAAPWWEVFPSRISYLTAPISWQGKTTGIIEVASPSSIRQFGDDDLRLLSLFVNQAAIALENSNLYRLIAEDQRRMEAMLHSINDGVIAVNNEAQIILVNGAAESILNLPPFHRIHERHIKEVIRNPDLCNLFLRSLNASKEMAEEIHLGPPDRKILEVETSLIETSPDERIGIIAVIRDITALRELEQVKSDFVSTVSHELRTPLTSIKAYIATLRREDVEFDHKTRQEFLKVVEEETDRLTRLIADILDVSRIESGKMELKKRDFDMVRLVQIVTEKIQSQALQHHIKLEVPQEVGTVNADPDKIEQVVMNLVDNAVKYSPSGGEITVTLKPVNRKLELSVADHGVGIPEDHLPHIFEKFHRVDNRATREVYGTGLGLYVSKSIVEAHGGTIWAESALNKGSVFHFTLPFSYRQSQGDQAPGPDYSRKGPDGGEKG